MVSGPIVHIIGTMALIIVLVSITLYSYVNVNLMVNENLRNIFKAIADNYASTIRLLYEERSNNTIVKINNPIEVSSRKYYNVYIGYGESLLELFPNIREDPEYNDYNLYVVVSSPDGSVYAYSRALPVEQSEEPPVLIGKGRIYRLPEYRGFLPGEGYSEKGLQWVCRMPIIIVENSGRDLINYLVLITLNLNNMVCSYRDKVYYPHMNDIRFTDSDGKTRLDYWIEYWDEINGIARVWVKLNISAGETKTVYAYWGQPLAQSLSDPSVFVFFENLSKYENLVDLLSSGNWHLMSKGGADYILNSYTLQYSSNGYNGLKLDTTLERRYDNAFTYIFSANYFKESGQGFICEGLVAPLTDNAHDVTFSIYNSSDDEHVLKIVSEPGVYDYYSSEEELLNYTIIWGNWNIENLTDSNNETYPALRGVNTGSLPGIRVAAIVRNNTDYWSYIDRKPSDQINFTFIAKLYIEPDSVYRGVVIAENVTINQSNTKSYGIGLIEDSSGLKLVLTDIPNNFVTTLLSYNTSVKNYKGWIYLKVSAKCPGQATLAWDIYVYDQSGNLLIKYHDTGTNLGALEPRYMGFYIYSYNEIVTSAYFKVLVSTVYNTTDIGNILGENYLDIGTLYVIGYPPGWNITIYDAGYEKIYSAVVQDNGIAYINASTAVLLGTNGTLYFTARDQYGYLAYYFRKDTILPGGSIVKIDLRIDDPMVSVMAGIHTIRGQGFDWYFVYNLDGESYRENKLTTAFIGVPVILGVGLYNNQAYYYIYDSSYNLKASGSTPFLTNGVYRIVFGSLKIGDDTEIFTSGFYAWIRVRPFVYPEPSVNPQYDSIEPLAILSPPIIKYDLVSDYVVYGSTLMVDLALVIQDNKPIIIVLFEGVRYT